MSRRLLPSRTTFRKWLNPYTYFDGWFTLLERGRSALRHALEWGSLLSEKAFSKRRRSFLPQVEGLEVRTLMTSVLFFNTSSPDVNYDATLINLDVRLSNTSSATITVHYSTNNGTAIAGTDFTGISSGLLTFQPGVSVQDFTVSMLDHKESSDVNFSVTLSSPSNATLGSPSTATVTIVESPLLGPVVDLNADVILPSNGTPIITFGTWNMSLAAELSGATLPSYSWMSPFPKCRSL